MTQSQNPEAIRKIRNRLSRASGQLNAVIAAIDSGAECKEVVTQLAAVSKAIDRAGYAIIATAMRDCVDNEEDASLTVQELEKLFLTLS